MGGANAPAPVGGASDVPPQGGQPSADGGVSPIGDDIPVNGPTQGGAPDGMTDGNGQLDPNMDAMGGDAPMDDSEPMDGGGDDSTMSIINSLNDKHKETVRAYAQSLRDEEEENGGTGDEPSMDGGDMGDGDTGGQDPNAEPMMESYVFTKGQLKKIHESLAITEPEKDTNKIEKKRGKALSNKSPFKSPKFD